MWRHSSQRQPSCDVTIPAPTTVRSPSHFILLGYPNLTDVENTLDKKETYVRVETESISQPNRESSEASKQNFEDPPNNKDQDIVQDQDMMQEQTRERIQPENKIIFFNSTLKSAANMD